MRDRFSKAAFALALTGIALAVAVSAGACQPAPSGSGCAGAPDGRWARAVERLTSPERLAAILAGVATLR